MSSEREMRQRVVGALRPLHAVSVENGVGVGTPDVNYAHGWIELKSVERWPKDPAGVLRVEHFTPAQRIWLRARQQAGGLSWLLLKVDRDWLLFRGDAAAETVGVSDRWTLIERASKVWTGGLDEGDLLAFLGCSRKT